MPNLTPKEADEQMMLFEWAGYRSPVLELMFAIPNGGSRDLREAKRLKDQGVKAGVPDIFLPVPRGGYHGLFIELKRTQGGRVSDKQKEWIQHLRMQGYQAIVCHGCDEAAHVIDAYLSGDPI